MRYQDAGVNIDEADRAVSSIRKLARGTFTRFVSLFLSLPLRATLPLLVR
jgi:phosphoribosylaminoimidazole (AIR) synthetase